MKTKDKIRTELLLEFIEECKMTGIKLEHLYNKQIINLLLQRYPKEFYSTGAAEGWWKNEKITKMLGK